MKIILTVACSLFCFSVHADEIEERAAAQRQAGQAFRIADFAELERLASEFRTGKTRTGSGTWRLSLFYKGIANDGLSFEKDDNVGWVQGLSTFNDWAAAYPDSPTPHIAHASALMGRAWYVRGGGYSSSVSKADLARYQELAIQAAEVLAKHEELAALDPHWYYVMADVYRALGVDKDSFWQLVSDGLDRFPDYDDILFVAGSYYARIWYGSDKELETFARMALSKTQETRGFEVYPRIYWVAGKIDRQLYAFQSPSAVWADMVSGMDTIIERYPSQWNIQHFAFFACWTQDSSTTKRYLALIREPLIKESGMSEANLQTCQSMVEHYEK